MKRSAIIFALAIFLVATPALAKKDETKSNSKKSEVSIEQTCDPNNFWKNHGQYVSCVAKLHEGGGLVAAAAKAEIGKKPKATPAPLFPPSPSPSVSPTPNPSESPSPSPSASPTASPSASAEGTPLDAFNASRAELEVKALIEVLKNIITSLQNLMVD